MLVGHVASLAIWTGASD